ncbi:type II CRISPR RNA-guided endonuclease Cas9 [uncultured Winogradskyella sp.]|uniref:type II CRISPR RNA-guided endonuclease Cas9 n=1 Tax=uncultured Winogradskyella sp. TaxID=395353 RepID=UPI00261C99CD|nr:type II CRISPR RNA-guided endonuclease Cas9 [uncultured Winogradskyella sp.]
MEHIIPKALLFDDSFSNKTLAYRNVNLKKANRTAFDFMSSDYQSDLENYKERVNSLYNNGKGAISKAKRNKLLLAQSKLPEGFIDRDLRNSQYIAKKAKQLLFEVFSAVLSTSGSITGKLREDWDLINVMKELNMPKYKALGLTEIEVRKNNKKVEVIKDWSKRNDHRHHAMDALTVAFTTHNHIQYLNNLNARNDERLEMHKVISNIQNKITHKNEDGKRRFIKPMPSFRKEAKVHIEQILVSFKNKNKVVTNNINKSKLKGKDNYHKKLQLTPRGQLHKETVYGKNKRQQEKPTKISKRFTIDQAQFIINVPQRKSVLSHLKKYDNKNEIAFDTKTLKKDPLLYNNEPLKEVLCFEEIYTIRKDINSDNFKDEKALNKVVDLKTRQILLDRLREHNNKPKEAFSDLEKKPIWLNESKGISIKRVTITGVSNAEPLHYKKDHLGQDIFNASGSNIPADFVSTGNNHHVAIYKDKDDKLQEKVVSFYEAVIRVNQDLPVIDKSYNLDLGWQFLFTMKQNEMFVFSSDGFNPNEVDLMDENNFSLISPNLYRVQKIATKNYMFRHHLETTVEENKTLKDLAYINVRSTEPLRGVVKLRINHIGEIVQIGEY